MPVELKRNISLSLLTFYGLGTIVGAGIFVLTGVIVGKAGIYAPLSFLFAAIVAAPTAHTYARLSSRFPKSAGEAVYVEHAFNNQLFTNLTGALVVVIGIISAATISRGFVGYVDYFVDTPDTIVTVGFVISLGALAAFGVMASVLTASVIAIISITGLLLVIYGGLDSFASGHANELIALNSDLAIGAGFAGVMAGAFLAFYAFIGFEDIVNMAEETVDAPRTLPLAIYFSLVGAATLYVLTTVVAVTTVPLEMVADDPAPIARIIEYHDIFNPELIAIISMLAVVNSALVQIIMASRVIYGMSRLGRWNALLGELNPRTQTPVYATVLASAVVLVLATTLNLTALAGLTSAVTLVIFCAINIALIKLGDNKSSIVIAWIGAILCIALLLMSLSGLV